MLIQKNFAFIYLIMIVNVESYNDKNRNKNLNRSFLLWFIINSMTSAADDEKKLYTNTKTREDLDYVCDLCGARFYNQNKLHKHRAAEHKASVE